MDAWHASLVAQGLVRKVDAVGAVWWVSAAAAAAWDPSVVGAGDARVARDKGAQ